jgi:hypothetical protein
MDYNKLIESTYAWVSFKGAFWFIIFFLISCSIIIFTPLMVNQGLFFNEASISVVNVLYFFNLIVFFVAFFSLIEFVLDSNGFNTQKISIEKLLDSFFLLILFLWYVFIWNIHRPHRILQIISLFVSTFAFFSLTYYNNSIIAFAAIIFGLLYLEMVIVSCVKLSFGHLIFYIKKVSIKEALLDSWKISENRVGKMFTSYIVGGVTIIIFASIIIFVGGFFIDLLIGPSFIPPVSYKLSMFIASVFALAPIIIAKQALITEVYSQIKLKSEINRGVARILTKRILLNKRNQPIKKVKSKLVKKKLKSKFSKKNIKSKIVKKKLKSKFSKKNIKSKIVKKK